MNKLFYTLHVIRTPPLASWRLKPTNLIEPSITPVTDSYMDYTQNSMETVTDFIFLGSKITADSDCSH